MVGYIIRYCYCLSFLLARKLDDRDKAHSLLFHILCRVHYVTHARTSAGTSDLVVILLNTHVLSQGLMCLTC